MYIADQILPRIKVNKKSDTIAKYTKADWFRDEAKVRAPGTKPQRIDYGLDTAATYSCINYALAKAVPYEVRDNADDPFRPDIEAVEFITDKILLAHERRVAAQLFDASTNFSSYTATAAALSGGGDAAWSTYATSTPLKDIEVMCDLVRAQIGRRPNTLVMGATVWKQLKWHPDLTDVLKAERAIMTPEIFASVVEIPRIFIGNAVYSATGEGASFSSSDIWGNYVLACWVPPVPSLMVPALGYTFQWGERVVKSEELAEGQNATLHMIEEFTDELILAADAGYLLSSVV
jgi:hypothetical protein